MVRVQPGAVNLEEIRHLQPFSALKDSDLSSLAMHAERVTFEPADRIITEGDAGDYFYVIVSGEVKVLREDDNGAQELLNYLSQGAFFGEEALLSHRPRNATVEGVKAGQLLRFSAQSVRIFETDPQLAKIVHEISRNRSAVSTYSFPGQAPGELCLAVERRHTYALAESIISPLVTAIVMSVGLAVLTRQGYFDPGSTLIVGALLAAGLTIWMLWLIADWWVDQYIVTPKRVIEIERVLLFYEKRLEAPIEQIQSVNIKTPFLMGNLIGYQDVLIQTGSSSQPLKFAAVANAERLKDKILEARSAALSQETSAQRQQIEDVLRRRMEDGGLPQPKPTGAEIIDELPPREYQPGLLGTLWRVIDYLIPRVQERRKTAVLWRRHPYILIRGIILPLLVCLLIVPLSILAFFDAPPLDGLFRFAGGLPLLLLLNVAAFAWLLWSYEDWNNDYYAVTDTQMIDRNSLPLGIREDKRTGPFDAIQDVNVDVSGFFEVLLRMGDVLVSTSGQGEAFKFDSMYRPRDVQQEIMRRLNAYRDRLHQRQAEQRRSEMADWFAVYRGLADCPESKEKPS